MFLGFEFTLFIFVLVIVPVYWIFRAINSALAIRALISVNIFLIWFASPALLFFLATQLLFVTFLFFTRNWVTGRWKTAWPWFSFIGVVPSNITHWYKGDIFPEPMISLLGGATISSVFWTLGSSFFVIKSFVVLRESMRTGEISVQAALANLTFVPAFAAGPIMGAGPWKAENLKTRISWPEIATALMKIGWGAAALYVIAPMLGDASKAVRDYPLGNVAEIYLRFGALYFDFSGYSLLAIAFGSLFGATIPVNFNRPYLATSITEFWRRWHMSLSWFIGTYLFKPFVRTTGSQRWGIFLAFVSVGLWHQVALGYFLWGIGHGAALSMAMKPPKIWKIAMAALPAWCSKLIGWFLTMSWVALLSNMATVWIRI